MAAQAYEEREEKASSSHSIMAEFYVLENKVYVAVSERRALERAISAPGEAMWLPPSNNVKAVKTTEEAAARAADYNIFKEKGLDSDGIRVLGELEQKL